mmetsp:Transcript_27304/g.47101  ORF Transcript_27304/g.47101 Transcript_27304/m.47101 type:complete len:615 (+) Transcript_27304:168-2012(+)
MNPFPIEPASLYVGDLHPDVTEAVLFEIFSTVGPVASIRVNRDALTRRSLGYAYVNFHNSQDADRALESLNYTNILGKPCRIMWSQRDPSLRKSGTGNVFVKNLDKSIDHKALYDTFIAFGAIRSCKVAVDPSTGQSKGHGFVHFETQEAADLAVQKVNGMLLNGKQVFVGPFVRRMNSGAGHAERNFTNIFVKNLNLDVDEDKLREMFQQFGEITSSIVMRDETGASRGFGFVNFDNTESAKKAAEAMNGQNVGGDRPLFVGRAQKKAEREAELRSKFEHMKLERIQKYQGCNTYVKNIDDSIDEEKLKVEFSPYGTIVSCAIMKDDKGIPKGFGFVCFSTPEEAQKAVAEMNGKMLASKPLYVALHQRKDQRRAQLEAHIQQRQVPNGYSAAAGAGPAYAAAGAQPMYYPQPIPYGGRGQMMYAYGPPQQPPMYVRGAGQANGPPGSRGYPPGAAPGRPLMVPPGAAPGMPVQKYSQVPGPGRGNRGHAPGAGRGARAPAANGMPPAALPATMAQGVAPAAGTTPLTVQQEEQQKQLIGERLFPLVRSIVPETAGKITGMLLEMEIPSLLQLLESRQALDLRVAEATQVLVQAQAQAQATATSPTAASTATA